MICSTRRMCWHLEYKSTSRHPGHLTAQTLLLCPCRCPVGDDPESWQQQRSLLRSAPLESMKAKRMQRMQKAKQAMGEHIWKASANGQPPLLHSLTIRGTCGKA